jgi:hypothetical protein
MIALSVMAPLLIAAISWRDSAARDLINILCANAGK